MTITQQQLVDAGIDAETLALVTNGAADRANPPHPNGTVTTRTGLVVRTLARIVADQVTQEQIATAQAGIATTKAAEAAASATGISGTILNATAGGTANALTLTSAPAIGNPALMPILRIKVAATMTATGLVGNRVTLAYAAAGIAASSLVDGERVAVSPRMLETNNEALVTWVPAWNQWLLLAGGQPLDRLVFCTVVSGGDTSAPVIRLPHAGIRLADDYAGTYFEFIPTADKPVGSASYTLQASDGTVLLAGSILREYDQTTNIGEGGWLANEPVRFERLPSGIARRVPIAPAAKLRQRRDWVPDLPSPELPGQMRMLDGNRMVVTMKNKATNHRNGYLAAHDDRVVINLTNIGKLYPTHSAPVMTIPQLWDITASQSRMMGQDIVWDAFNYTSIFAATSNTGLPPSAGALAIAGDTTGTAAEINAGNLSGFYHGRVNVTALTMIATNDFQGGVPAGGGILNGVPIAANTNIRLSLNSETDVSFDTFTITQTMTIAGPSGGIFSAGVIVTHIFDAVNGTVEKRVYVPFGALALVTFGYLCMWPFQWANKMDWLSTTGAITRGINVGPGAGSSGILPVPRRLELYRSELPSHRMQLSIPAGFTPYQVDGVSPITPPEQVVINSTTHGKFYIVMAEAAATIEDLANKVYESRLITKWFRADDIA